MGKLGWALVLGGVCAILGSFDLVNYYRKALLLVHELRFSTKNSYLEAEKTFDASDLDVDLTGRVFLITGASAGIGKSTALAIAERSGTVHMVSRNQERSKQARDEIASKTGNQNVYTHTVDLSNLNSVHNFVEKFIQLHNKLDVLINNAGAMINERTLTSEDLEANFATNTMAYYILTKELLSILKKSEIARVVIVSSAGLLQEKLDVEDLQFESKQFSGDRAYSQCKRHQVIMGEELANRHPDIQFSSMHPGWVDTAGLKTSMPDFYNLMKTKLRTPEQGADTVVWLAISNRALSFKSGLFFLDRKPIPTHHPLAWTEERNFEHKQLMKKLEKISQDNKPCGVPHEFFEEG